MPDPLSEKSRLNEALDAAAEGARGYLERLGDEPVQRPGTEDAIRGWEDPMPEHGDGTSAVQAIGMLGLGRGNVERLARGEAGRLDLEALERRLGEEGSNAIVVAKAARGR